MEQNKSSAEEIDLVYYFKWLKHKVADYIAMLTRNRTLFLSLFFTVLLAGIAMRFVIPKKYTTAALIISYNIPADFVMISYLQSLAADKNSKGLSKELNLSRDAAKMITHISATRMDSAFRFSATDSSGSIIRVNLVIKDLKMIQQVQDGLMHYLKTNEYSSKKRLARQGLLESLKDELIRQSKGLDSLKETGSNGIVSRSTEKGIVLEKAVNPVSINMLQLDYYRQVLQIEDQLERLENVEIVQPFPRNNLDSSPLYKLIFLYFAVAGFLLALLLTPVLGKR